MLEKRMPFAREEYMQRMEKIQALIEERNLDVLVLHCPENVYYACGGDNSAGYYMYNCLVIGRKGDPFLITRFGEVGNGRVFSYLDDDHLVFFDDTDDPIDKTVEIIKKVCSDPKRIGLEITSFFLSVKNYQKLAAAMPGVEFVEATGLVEDLRMVKSEAELNYIRQAAKAVNAAVRAGVDAIKEGENENNVAAAIWYALCANGCGHLGMEPFVAKGWKSGLMHQIWSGEIIKAHEPILLEIPACINRYHAVRMHTVCVGDPTPEVRHFADVCLEALEAALKVIGPGVMSGDVDEACRGVIERAGLYNYFRKRTGYSVGSAFAPDWGEGHICSLQKGDKRLLVPGMVYHMPPAIRMPGEYGVGFSETVIITETGCEIITDFPRELTIK